MSNMVILKNNKPTLLKSSEFLEELRSQRHKKEKIILEEAERQFSKEKQMWQRMTLGIAITLVGRLLKRSCTHDDITARDLLGMSGVERYTKKWRVSSGAIGIIEETLRRERLLDNWMWNYSEIDIKRYLKREYGNLSLIDDRLKGNYNFRGPVRYYRVSEDTMSEANEKRNTYLMMILGEVEKILIAHGYSVKNTLKISKWQNTKHTVYYEGGFRVSAV